MQRLGLGLLTLVLLRSEAIPCISLGFGVGRWCCNELKADPTLCPDGACLFELDGVSSTVHREMTVLPPLGSLDCAILIWSVVISATAHLSAHSERLFAGTPNLLRVSIHDNDKLVSLPPTLFVQTPNLRTLVIHDNLQLNFLPDQLLAPVAPSLRTVSIYN